jgi:hypothetical protein
VAVCNWIVEISADDVIASGGIVPPKELKEILLKVASLLA